MLLDRKNILITGSSRGIGQEIAKTLASHGANVCVHYQYSQKNAHDLVDLIHKEYGVKVLAIQADMNDPKSITGLFQTLKSEWNQLDGLILNAASGNRKKLLDQTQEDWDRISHINVLGPIQCVREALPLFLKYKGKIIFLSSEGARYGIRHYGAIGVTKAALEAAMRQITVELKDTRIQINALSATLVRTQALEAVTRGQMDLFREEYFIDPKDIAKMCVFLMSDLCPSSLKGQTLKLDNGTLSEFEPHARAT